MTELNSQIKYWDEAAPTKTFTHPVEARWLSALPRDSAVLDYGCGYGRAIHDLRALGFTDVTGVDTSPGMIERGRREQPDARLEVIDDPPAVPYADDSFDLVLLLAVLTCVPEDMAQNAIMAEISRVLRPGGLLYLSDVPLQDDARSQQRYAKWVPTYSTFGVFETDDGAICRHNTTERLSQVLEPLTVTQSRSVDVRTMNGNRTVISQFLARQEPLRR